MKKIIRLFLVSIMMSVGLLGCAQQKTISKDYEIGVVYTSNNKKKSTIKTYHESGEFIEERKLNVGGINLANFYKNPIKTNENIYYTMPVLGNRSQDFIIEIDRNDLSYRKIHNADKKGVTSFAINEESAFLAISDVYETDLTKINLTDTAQMMKTIIEGSCKMTILNNETLYLFNDMGDSTIRIYEVNIHDLEIVSYTDVLDASFITDAVIKDQMMYVLINRDGLDQLSNRMMALNLETKVLEEIKLPFHHLSKIYSEKEHVYVIENDYLGIEKTENRVAKLAIDMSEIQIFQTRNNHLATDVNQGKLYSTDGEKVYIYDLESLNLLHSFQLTEQKNEFVVSIFTK